MKIVSYLLLALAGICFFEVYYIHSMLSFIDTPYLYAGLFLLGLSALSFYQLKKKNEG